MLSILITQESVCHPILKSFKEVLNFSQGNWPILRNIWRKWDFLKDHPLPDGIVHLIFQKDLEIYVLQKSSAPMERRGEEFILCGEAS